MILLSFLILALPAPAADLQSPAESPPLPPGVVARLNGDEISRADYMEYLYDRFGKRGVRDMIGEMLVEKEAARYGITVDPLEVDRLTEERLAASRGQADEAAFIENLRRNGQSLAMHREALRREIGQDQLLRGLVRKTRVATDDRIAQFFERKYGISGVRLRVRHILVMPNILRADLVRGGTQPADIDMAALKDQARQICTDARARLLAGEDFATVAADLSHDRVTKEKGGEIQNYNGRLYGPAFRSALDQIEIGQVSAVVESGAGFHVVELLERTATRIEEVLDEITAEILAAEPTYQEMAGLRNSLVEQAKLELW